MTVLRWQVQAMHPYSARTLNYNAGVKKPTAPTQSGSTHLSCPTKQQACNCLLDVSTTPDLGCNLLGINVVMQLFPLSKLFEVSNVVLTTATGSTRHMRDGQSSSQQPPIGSTHLTAFMQPTGHETFCSAAMPQTGP